MSNLNKLRLEKNQALAINKALREEIARLKNDLAIWRKNCDSQKERGDRLLEMVKKCHAENVKLVSDYNKLKKSIPPDIPLENEIMLNQLLKTTKVLFGA